MKKSEEAMRTAFLEIVKLAHLTRCHKCWRAWMKITEHALKEYAITESQELVEEE